MLTNTIHSLIHCQKRSSTFEFGTAVSIFCDCLWWKIRVRVLLCANLMVWLKSNQISSIHEFECYAVCSFQLNPTNHDSSARFFYYLMRRLWILHTINIRRQRVEYGRITNEIFFRISKIIWITNNVVVWAEWLMFNTTQHQKKHYQITLVPFAGNDMYRRNRRKICKTSDGNEYIDWTLACIRAVKAQATGNRADSVPNKITWEHLRLLAFDAQGSWNVFSNDNDKLLLLEGYSTDTFVPLIFFAKAIIMQIMLSALWRRRLQ